jgi:hypothetical protein
MGLVAFAVDREGQGDLLLVAEPGDFEGWAWRPEHRRAYPVSVASVYTRDPYKWVLAPPGTRVPPEAEAAVAALGAP